MSIVRVFVCSFVCSFIDLKLWSSTLTVEYRKSAHWFINEFFILDCECMKIEDIYQFTDYRHRYQWHFLINRRFSCSLLLLFHHFLFSCLTKRIRSFQQISNISVVRYSLLVSKWIVECVANANFMHHNLCNAKWANGCLYYHDIITNAKALHTSYKTQRVLLKTQIGEIIFHLFAFTTKITMYSVHAKCQTLNWKGEGKSEEYRRTSIIPFSTKNISQKFETHD